MTDATVPRGMLGTSEPARTAHAAMVAGLAARLDVAHLLALEEFDQLRDGLVNAETLLARMHRRDVCAAQPVLRIAGSLRRSVLSLRRTNFRRLLLLRARVGGASGRARRVFPVDD